MRPHNAVSSFLGADAIVYRGISVSSVEQSLQGLDLTEQMINQMTKGAPFN
jgi:hypothetical protein